MSPAGKQDLPRFYQFGGFLLDVEKRLLLRNNESVPLMPKTFELLLALVRRHGQVVTKDELMAGVWHDSVVEENSLNVHVSALRKLFGEKPNEHRFIVTVPGRGYQFVAEVRDVFAAGEGIDAKPDRQERSPALSDPSKAKRIKKWLWPTIGVALIAAIALATWLVSIRTSTKAPVISRVVQLTTWSGLDFYPAISADGNAVAFSSDRTGSFEIYLRQLVAGAREVQLSSDGGQNFEPAFSPDGTLIAFYSRKRGGVWTVPTSGGAAKQLTNFGSHPAWSPDGSRIAFQSDPLFDLGFNVSNAFPPSTIWTIAVAGGEPRQITRAGNPAGGHGAPSWSPDGKRIAFDSSDTGIASVWSVSPEGNDLKKLSGELRNAADVIYAPDGRSVYFVTDRGESIQQISLSASGETIGKPSKILDASGSRIRQISVSANGKHLVYSALSTSSDIWSNSISGAGTSATEPPAQLTQNKNTRNSWPAFSPDGKRIASLVYSVGASFELWIMDRDGKNKSQLTTEGANPSWFPDGKRIGFACPAGNRSAFCSLTIEGRKQEKLFDFDDYTHVTRLSPDGEQVAFNLTRGETTNIWVASIEGGATRQLTFDRELAGFPSWSPDGKWIAFEVKRGDDDQVCIIPSGGGEVIQLTNDKGKSWAYAWSADGDKIIYAGEREGIWNIYWVSLATRQQKQLTNFTQMNTYVRYPAWSPAGDQIVYEHAKTTGNIWMVDLK
jgi:eukaryotic-like serine/threonine-protein kinase